MYSLDNLKKLRQETGVSFSLCKKALEEANNDLEMAKKILKKYGESFSEKKKKQATKIGAIFSYLHYNQKIAALVKLFCESDFVAKNEEFQRLGKDLVQQIASMNPKNLSQLLSQPFIKDPKKTIEQLIKEYVFKLGENIRIGKFIRYEI